MSATDQFLFLVSTTVSQNSVKDHDQDQQARAHAARRSHANRRSETSGLQKRENETALRPAAAPYKFNMAAHQRKMRLGITLTRTPFDNGNDEPFDSLAATALPPYVFSVLYTAFHHKWPRVRSIALDPSVDPVARAWMRAALESPIVLHASVYAMLRTILLARTAPSPENALALEQYARCLQYLMKDMRLIQDGINEPSDSLLIGTAALASHGELRSKRSMAADPRVQISPVAKTQNIDVYSSGQMEPVHMQAFYLLASQRGGLQACQLHGLADILEIIDLCFATRALAIPQFESRHTTFLVQLTGTFNFDAEAQALLQRFGEAFLESAELQPLHLTIHHMRTVVAALDQYVREGQKPASLPKLLQARNAVQYLLLSVSARKSASDTADCLVDMCRLGLLIFSNMVLFPLPTESGVAEMLVGALRGRLLESHVLEGHVDIWSQRSDLLTWIVTLGTMAATSTAYSQWYTQYLADMMPVGHLPGWHHLEETVLSKYAWWKYTCSNSGEGIWLESTLICERNNMQKAISGVKNGLNI